MNNPDTPVSELGALGYFWTYAGNNSHIKYLDQFTALVWLPKLSILKLVKNGEILKQVTVEKDWTISTFENECKQLTK